MRFERNLMKREIFQNFRHDSVPAAAAAYIFNRFTYTAAAERVREFRVMFDKLNQQLECKSFIVEHLRLAAPASYESH
jgi:hypothetical protein